MIKQQVDVLFMDGELMLGDTLRLYKGDNGILISVKVEKQYYKNNKLITENLIELGKYGRAIIRKGQHSCCSFHEEESEEPVYCSDIARIEDGRLDILIPKEAIDETSEMGTYQIQIQLYGNDTDLGRPRLTLDPFEFEACDLISDDLELDEPVFSDVPIVGIGEAGEAILREDGELPIKLEDGSFNKTEWKTNDVITAGRLNKMEEAMKSVYGIRAQSLSGGSLNEHIARIINSLIETPSLDTRMYTLISGVVYVDLSDGTVVVINEGSERNEGTLDFTFVPNGAAKKAKVKFTLTTNKALIIGDFSLNMGDSAAILDNDKIHIIEGVDMTGIATEMYVAKTVDEAIDEINTLEVVTVGNDGIMLLNDGDGYEIFELNIENIKPEQENHFVFKKVKILCKDANGNDNTLYFDDTFVCITVMNNNLYEIKEFRTGVVHSIVKPEGSNAVLNYSSRPMTDIEYNDIRDIVRIDNASAIEYFRSYFGRDGLYYFGNVSIKCIVGGKSKIVSFTERLVEITIYNSYINLYDYKDCLIYKFNHNGSKITGFVGQGSLTDAHEVRLNEQVNSAINTNVVPVYATKKELNDAINNIDIPEVDLTGLATKEELDVKANKDELFSKDYNDLENKPEIPSVEGLASEEYVSETVTGSIDGFKTEFPYKVIDSEVIRNADIFNPSGVAVVANEPIRESKIYFFKNTVQIVAYVIELQCQRGFRFDNKLVEVLYNNPNIEGIPGYLIVTQLDTGVVQKFNVKDDGSFEVRPGSTSTPYPTRNETMGFTSVGQDNVNTEFDVNLISLYNPNLNNFFFNNVIIRANDRAGNVHESWFDGHYRIEIPMVLGDGAFYFNVINTSNGSACSYQMDANGNVIYRGESGSYARIDYVDTLINDRINYALPLKKIVDVEVTTPYQFEMDPTLYLLNNVTILANDGSSYYFGNSLAKIYRDDYTIYIEDYSNCRFVYFALNGGIIERLTGADLFISIRNELCIRRATVPEGDTFRDLIVAFNNANGLFSARFDINALDENGNSIVLNFGSQIDRLIYVYANRAPGDTYMKIYSYEQMKTYKLSVSSYSDIPTLVSVESNIPAPEVDLSGYATEEYVNQKIADIEISGGTDLSGYVTKEEFNSLGESVGNIESAITSYVSYDEFETRIGNIDAILDSINGEVI